MNTNAIAWQLDFFGEAAPAVPVAQKRDPLPDPQFWSGAVKDQMIDALISLACDSRRGDNMPESLTDCAEMLRARMSGTLAEFVDYQMTLGWIFQYWYGALPYRYVCAVTGVDPEVLQDVILNNSRLKRDLDEVRNMRCGTLL
ncbi:hypothetical protein ACI2UK_13810 [Ralstonia nicotianae]|uniref:hypothetical protein n=1 Tax=Ralstonia pseudosolanacearum TaxID=1310165 RepID=UPI0020041547|nr:hypothetical protein [Ralstonia pseudosolanacearum]MCK4118381.1 hypothetical protein [Ralstonia pseudosolanacearum]